MENPDLHRIEELLYRQEDPNLVMILLTQMVKESSLPKEFLLKVSGLKAVVQVMSNSQGSLESSGINESIVEIVKELKKSTDHLPLDTNGFSLTPQILSHTVLTGKGLVKQYNGEKFRLGPVNCELKLGQITGLVGLNGHGKSTLLRMMAGILEPDAGTVTLHKNPDRKRSTLKVGYLPQQTEFDYGCVMENLQLAASMEGIYGAENDKEVEFVMCRLGLSSYKSHKCKTLSGGYKLRFALAKLLVKKPDILLLDEPLANLDIRAQSNLLMDLKNLTQSITKPLAVLISSQHIEEVESISQNMIVLDNGSAVFSGPRQKIAGIMHGNVFEVLSPLAVDELKVRLGNFPIRSINQVGFFIVIKTDENVSRTDFLAHCAANSIDLSLFNDISQSVKRLILELPESL